MKWYYKKMHNYYFRKSVDSLNWDERDVVYQFYIGKTRIYGRKAGIIK